MGDAGRDVKALAAAILVPIAFCLVRAALTNLRFGNLSAFLRVAAQLSLGFALISLLIFEMGVAMFAGAADIPAGVWCVLLMFGVAYICLYVTAHRLAHHG